ncbi:MAG: M28 family peptidase [Myxococcota bacterium]
MRARLLPFLLTVGCTTSAADDSTTTPPDASTSSATEPPTASSGVDSATGKATSDGPADSSGGSVDSTGLGSTGEPGCPALPDPTPSWLLPMQEDIVARLAGATELTPGVTLSDRSTPASRAATRDFLVEQLDTLGLGGQLQTYSDTGTNVYAALPATLETNRTIVIGAHFDSVPGSPGANDNATGVAMVLSLGRWLQDLPCRDLNVLLVLFDEEEIGLLGSFGYAQWLAAQDLDVVSVHTIDQMGWDANGDRGLEIERPDPGLLEVYEQAEPLAPGDTPLTETQTGFTDHVSFRKLGFDAVGLTEQFVTGDTTPHYHLPSDTFETVDLGFLASSTVLLHVAIGGLVASEPDA